MARVGGQWISKVLERGLQWGSSPLWRVVACIVGLGSPGWGQKIGGCVLDQGISGSYCLVWGLGPAAQFRVI